MRKTKVSVPFWLLLCVMATGSFTTLKVMGVVGFSWWIAFAPLWVPLLIYALGWVVFETIILWLSHTFKYDDSNK